MNLFLPINKQDMAERGWDQADFVYNPRNRLLQAALEQLRLLFLYLDGINSNPPV